MTADPDAGFSVAPEPEAARPREPARARRDAVERLAKAKDAVIAEARRYCRWSRYGSPLEKQEAMALLEDAVREHDRQERAWMGRACGAEVKIAWMPATTFYCQREGVGHAGAHMVHVLGSDALNEALARRSAAEPTPEAEGREGLRAALARTVLGVSVCERRDPFSRWVVELHIASEEQAKSLYAALAASAPTPSPPADHDPSKPTCQCAMCAAYWSRATPSGAPVERVEKCACGHFKSGHPFGLSGNLRLTGACQACDCRRFTAPEGLSEDASSDALVRAPTPPREEPLRKALQVFASVADNYFSEADADLSIGWGLYVSDLFAARAALRASLTGGAAPPRPDDLARLNDAAKGEASE